MLSSTMALEQCESKIFNRCSYSRFYRKKRTRHKFEKERKKSTQDAETNWKKDEIKFKQTLVHIKNYYDFFPLYFRIVVGRLKKKVWFGFERAPLCSSSCTPHSAKQNRCESNIIFCNRTMLRFWRSDLIIIVVIIISVVLSARLEHNWFKLQLQQKIELLTIIPWLETIHCMSKALSALQSRLIL